jgi:hypothetical protein
LRFSASGFFYGMRIAPLELGVIRVRFLRRLKAPASESQVELALALSLVILAAMLFGLLWQSSIIALQQDLIRSLWLKFAG